MKRKRRIGQGVASRLPCSWFGYRGAPGCRQHGRGQWGPAGFRSARHWNVLPCERVRSARPTHGSPDDRCDPWMGHFAFGMTERWVTGHGRRHVGASGRCPAASLQLGALGQPWSTLTRGPQRVRSIPRQAHGAIRGCPPLRIAVLHVLLANPGISVAGRATDHPRRPLSIEHNRHPAEIWYLTE